MLFIFGFYITTFAIPAVAMLGYWFLVQVLSGVATLSSSGGGVAFWAHVGSFAAGLIVVMLFRNKQLLDKHPYHGFGQYSTPTKRWRKIDRR